METTFTTTTDVNPLKTGSNHVLTISTTVAATVGAQVTEMAALASAITSRLKSNSFRRRRKRTWSDRSTSRGRQQTRDMQAVVADLRSLVQHTQQLNVQSQEATRRNEEQWQEVQLAMSNPPEST